MTANSPQEATGARLAGERAQNEEHGTETPNGPQTGAQPLLLPEFIDVAEYRHDRGHQAWAWRCWGDGTCDGWLSLDHSSEDSATRSARRHLTEDHGGPDA